METYTIQSKAVARALAFVGRDSGAKRTKIIKTSEGYLVLIER